IGAIFLLFTVGLETNPKDLLQVGRTSLYVALAGIAAPFILGFGYMMLRRGSAHEATFVAAAMVATSVGITARVLGDMHVLQSLPARIILGAAGFEEIVRVIALRVATRGVAWAELIVKASEAVGVALVML